MRRTPSPAAIANGRPEWGAVAGRAIRHSLSIDFLIAFLRFSYSLGSYSPFDVSRELKTFGISGTDAALPAALNTYREYETAKVIRQTLGRKLAIFVLGIGILTLGLHFLPIAALLTTVLIAAGMFGVASSNERNARRRLTEQLSGSRRQ